MKYSRVALNDGGLEYRIQGGFQVFFWDRLMKSIENDVLTAEAAYFQFDLSGTSWIDSMAVSILVRTGKYNAERGRKLPVKNPTDSVRDILKTAELNFIEYV